MSYNERNSRVCIRLRGVIIDDGRAGEGAAPEVPGALDDPRADQPACDLGPEHRDQGEPGILRHLSHFASGHTSGYLGTVQEKTVGSRTGYDALAHDIILHGSPATVAEKIAHLRDTAGMTSIMVHYPPWYGVEKALASLELFAREVAPKFKASAPQRLRVKRG